MSKRRVPHKKCECGKVIKTKAARVCQSCRPQQYKEKADRIIEAKIRKNNTLGRRPER